MTKTKLTEAKLKTIKHPESGRNSYGDQVVSGLELRVGTTKKTWRFEKRIRGTKNRFKATLGSYPAMSLADARMTAKELSAKADLGIDPSEEKRKRQKAEEEAKTAKTVASALQDYEVKHASTLATGEERMRELRKFLDPHRNQLLNDLETNALQKIVDDLKARGKTTYANRIRAYIRGFTKWAFQRSLLKSDVGINIVKAGSEQPRDHCPTIEEVQLLYKHAAELGPQWRGFFRILILTGQRRGEILALRWKDIDRTKRQLKIPSSHAKNNREHIVHLAEPTLSELDLLSEGAEGSYVFPSRKAAHLKDPKKAKQRLDALLGDTVDAWRIHDLRRSLVTGLADNGVPAEIADKILNHRASGTTASAVAHVYQKSEFLTQRADALNLWADVISEDKHLVGC